jgi:V/A-type H+-transporting ATPase subunit E
MSDKINVIARKIYEEGLEKAQQESESIIGNAKAEAEKILSDAQKKAEKTIKDAELQAEKEKKIIDSEMKLASEQLLDSLRQRIKELVSHKLLDGNLKKAFEDPEFVKSLVIEIAKNWDAKNGLNIKLGESLKGQLEEALKSGLKDVVKDLDITDARDLSTGFVIEDKGDHFEIVFSEDQFREFLKPFIKEKTHQLIFGNP